MHGYPQFSFEFRVLIAIAEICFFHIVISRATIPLYWQANSLRNPNISDQTRDAQNVCAVTERGTVPKFLAWFSSPACHTYCVTEDDSRLEQMCTNPLNKLGSAKENTLLGMEECRSPFGTYELQIPVDDSLECDVMGITNTNCKDLDVSYLDIK